MSSNNETLSGGVLRPELLNNLFEFCFCLNLDFLLLHTAHFDNNIVLPFFCFYHFGIYILCIFFCTCYIMTSTWKFYDLYYSNYFFLLILCFKHLDLSVMQLAHLDSPLIISFILTTFLNQYYLYVSLSKFACFIIMAIFFYDIL